MEITLNVNGRAIKRDIEPHVLLLDFLRDDLGLRGAKRSCDVQVCGSCTVLVDGLPVSACCHLAADAAGRRVVTVEGLAEHDGFARIQRAFTEHGALQCGFCTPGMVLTVSALHGSDDLRDEEARKHTLAGSICRCTGYRAILDAVAEIETT